MRCEPSERRKNPAGNGWNREEVHRDDFLGVILEKGLPALGWWPGSPHVFGDGRWAELDPQLQQFPVNPRRSPGGVVVSHLPDEFARLAPELWSTLLAFAALSRPERSKSLPMPTNHGFWPNHDQSAAPIGSNPAKENPDGAILVPQEWALFTATRDLQLMAEGDIL